MSNTILEQVKIRLRQFHIKNPETEDEQIVFDKPEENPILEQLISQATQDVVECRNYPESYTVKKIEDDLKKYDSVIVNLVLYDYNKEGGEFQDSSSENGTSRSWVKRETLMADVLPLVKVL